MAPDTTATSVAPASAVVAKLESVKASSSPPPPLSSTLLPTATSKPARNGLNSDKESDSSLSEVDSEAETERLHNSPQKARPKVVVQLANNSATSTTIPEETSTDSEPTMNHVDELANALQSMPAPTSPTPRSPTKKRKRDATDTLGWPPATVSPKSRSGTPPTKKKFHSPLPPQNGDAAMAGKGTTDAGAEPTAADKMNQSKTVTTTDADDTEETPPEPVNVVEPRTEPVETPTEAAENEEASHDDEEMEEDHADAPPLPHAEDTNGDAPVDVTREDDDETQEKDEKDNQKQQAMKDLAEIERIFAQLKDKMYSEKLRRVEIEMKLLDEGVHPEYLSQKVCIDNRLKEKLRLADAQYKYAMQSLNKSTDVHKAQLHSQYFQTVRDVREQALYQCGELLYHIHRERRSGDALVPDYIFRIADRNSTRINQRRQYNWEVGVLSGIAKHHGFPAAPDIGGATEEEKTDDLVAIGIAGIQRAPPPPARTNALVPNVMRLEPPYKKPSPSGHWPQSHQTPPSPVTQPHQHAHVHKHPHHHHHHRPHPAPQPAPATARPESVYPPRRNQSSLGPQPSQVPLSTLLHGSEGAIKMEPQPSTQSMSSLKNPDSYPTPFQGPLAHQTSKPYSLAHHYNRQATEQSQRAQSPTPNDRLYARDVDVDGMRRLKEDGETSSGIAGPLAGLGQRFGTAAAGRMGYS